VWHVERLPDSTKTVFNSSQAIESHQTPSTIMRPGTRSKLFPKFDPAMNGGIRYLPDCPQQRHEWDYWVY